MIARFLALSLVVTGLPVLAAESPINFKLGTLAPRDSSYHKSLLVMGEKWREASGGRVRLTVFPGGTQGGESDMVALMQTGSLDAGLLTASGLAQIEPAVNAVQSMPLAFHTLDEVDYVGEKLRPMLEQRLLAKGYLVLFWTDSGWVRFFSKAPILHPDDLKKLKVFSSANEVHQFDLWKASGFSPVALDAKDIPQGLMSGTISAVPTPPVFANFTRLDADAGHAKYMLELNWGPLVGAAVVRKKSWDRVPPDLQAAMSKIAAEAGLKVKAEGRAENERSVAAMVKRGLVVQPVSPEVEAEWRAAMDKVNDKIRGQIVPAEMYDEAQRLIREFRARGAGASK
jgi:TRAP-type transport system periplasmic protein